MISDLKLLKRFPATAQALVQLLEAAYPIHQAVLAVAACETDRRYREKLEMMAAGLAQGIPPHVAMSAILPIRLSIVDVPAMPDIRTVLLHIGAYVAQKHQAMAAFFRALIYPCVLLVGLKGVSLLFVFHVAPAMASLSEDGGGGVLGWVLGLRGLLLAYGDWVLLGMAVFWITAVWWGPKLWRVFLGLWFRPGAADVAWMLGVMLCNGVPMNTALSALAAGSSGQSIRWLQAEVAQSGQFAPAFIRFFQVRGIEAQLLVVAEKSGTLSTRLIETGKNLLAIDLQRLKNKIAIVQPVLLVIVGLMIWMMMQVMMAPLSMVLGE